MRHRDKQTRDARRLGRLTLTLAVAFLFMAASVAYAQAPPAEQPPTQPPAAEQPPTQQPPTQPPTQPPPQAEIELEEGELEQFANAYVAIAQVHEEFQPQMAGANDPQAAQQVQQEMETAMMAAIAENDLDVTRYQEIAMALNADPALAQEFRPILERAEQEREQEGGGPSY